MARSHLARRVRVPGQRVFDQYRVGPTGVQLAPGLVGDRHRGEPSAALEGKALAPGTRQRQEQPRTRIVPGSPVAGQTLRLARGRKAAFEVGQDVLDRLDADRQAHQVRADSGRHLLLGREL